jgi:predicted Rossmann fold nucleotide-binding protein DprA/Smf involved in DNA uptake
MTEALSPNTKAILLLTAPLITGRGKKSGDLLTPGEYKKLAKLLIELGAKPADLLTPAADQLLGDCHRVIDKARLERLLARGFLLSQAVERWHARAIWVVSRADDTYPQRLKKRLRENSPAILYGCGDRKILDGGGLAIVGSRNASEALCESTREIARFVASAGRSLVSGGARGIDQAAMRGALEAGGKVTGVLPASLEKTAMQREHRNMLLEGQLVLISPYDPSAGFNTGLAMQRNKLIYALADAALVMITDLKKGGTWAGAIEQLEKLRLVPVFVRKAEGGSPGLDALAKKGALPWPEPVDVEGLNAILATPPPEPESSSGQTQLSFAVPKADTVRDTDTPASGSQSIAPPSIPEPDSSPADELFATVRSLVLRLAREPMKATDIARGLGVTAPQAQKWLNLLVKDGTLEKSKRPVRYLVREMSRFEERKDPKPPSTARKRPGSRK